MVVLVHWVNKDQRLLESNYANDAASVRIRISWPQGRSGFPRVRTLLACEQTARC